jgi:transcriptional regulator with XRE-family HTH domain
VDFQALGEELRKARAARSRSLEDLASQLKIHRRHLEAMEEGDLARLPQGPYVKAFVREYARALGVTLPEAFSVPEAGPARGHRDPNVTSHPVGDKASGENAGNSFISQLSSLPMNAVKTVTKTTESVVNLVESSGKEALEVLTSKSLWDEAENVRRERHGLPPIVHKEDERHAEEMRIKNEEAAAAKEEEKSAAYHTARAHVPTPSFLIPTFARDATPKSKTNVIIGLLALLFAGAIFFAIRMSRSGSGTTAGDYVPAPIEKTAPLETRKVEKPAPPPPVAPAAAAISSKDSLHLTLRATQPVWISIAPDGVPAYRGELKAGDVRSFRAAQKIVVDLGNQKSVEMQLNGQRLSNLPAIQNSSVVVRNLVLTRDKVTLGGKPVDVAKLMSAPAPNSQRSVAHAQPMPPIPFAPLPATSAASRATKKSAAPSAPKKNASPSTPKSAGPNPRGAVTDSATPKGSSAGASKKPSKKSQPPVPLIHTVDPIPPRL